MALNPQRTTIFIFFLRKQTSTNWAIAQPVATQMYGIDLHYFVFVPQLVALLIFHQLLKRFRYLGLIVQPLAALNHQ